MFNLKRNYLVLLLALALPFAASSKNAYEYFISFEGANFDSDTGPSKLALDEANLEAETLAEELGRFHFSKFGDFAAQCAPNSDHGLMQAIVRTESKFHPYAIGVSRGPYIADQPKTVEQAVSMMKSLEARKVDYSAGLGQINVRNFKRFGLTRESVLDPCDNIKAMARVLDACSDLVNPKLDPVMKSKAVLTCYNTGNYKRSYMKTTKMIDTKYANAVLRAKARNSDGQELWWPDGAMETYAKLAQAEGFGKNAAPVRGRELASNKNASA